MITFDDVYFMQTKYLCMPAWMYLLLFQKQRIIIICFFFLSEQPLIQIREYYVDEKSQELRPGSKGIALNPAEWGFLCENIDRIDAAIEKHPLRERIIPLVGNVM